MFDYRPAPKPGKFKRKLAKTRKEFSAETVNRIYERDGYRCVRCGSPHLDSRPHHIIFKSQGGLGTADNGVSICRTCHTWAHSCREGRTWFEDYRERVLLQRGIEDETRI